MPIGELLIKSGCRPIFCLPTPCFCYREEGAEKKQGGLHKTAPNHEQVTTPIG